MKEVKLKKIKLRNYMNVTAGEWTFYNKTQIEGKNAVGKTTLMNAYFDVMTGKLANGTAPNNICPLDKEGNELPVKETERTIVLDIDGEEHEISKVTKRKYRKDVFVGNETTYRINGETVKTAEFTEFINSIASSDVVSMCSNASVFFNTLKKSTAEARKYMEKLSGFDLETFYSRNEEYKKAHEMTGGKPVEDVVKRLKSVLKSENNDLDRLNVELDYEYRRLDNMDKADMERLEAGKSALLTQIDGMESLKETLDVAVDRYTYLLGQADKKKTRMKAIEDEQTVEKREQLQRLSQDIKVLGVEIINQTEKLIDDEAENKRLEIAIEIKEKEKDCLEESLADCIERQYKGNDKCPTCGQNLSSKQLMEQLHDFEANKKSSITKLRGNIEFSENEIAFMKEEFAEKTKKISEFRKFLDVKKEEKEALEQKVNALYGEIKFTKTAEYLELEKGLKETEIMADEISNSGELCSEVMNEINRLKIELAAKEAEIKGVIKETEASEARIEGLKKSVKDQAQAAADVERNICILQDFSIAKNKAIEDMVNSKFEFINLKMSEETLDGTIKETLKIQKDGVDYFNGLNHGDRILAEIFLLKGLQDMNGMKLPIWVDDTESLDSERVPDVGRQMVLIRRTDDECLSVKRLED